MAASNFALACDAIVRERDRVFLVQIASDYNLNFDELSAKYLVTAEAAVKAPPRKYTKKATSVTIEKEPRVKAEKQCCTAQTSKKEPCKFASLKGEVFCKRHLRAANGEPAEPKAPKVKKAPKTDDSPVHSHPLDQAPVVPCDVCNKYGSHLEAVPTKFEVVKPVGTAAERLAAMLAEESDSESDSDAVGDFIEEEVYEQE